MTTPTVSQLKVAIENLQSRAWLARNADWDESDIDRFLRHFAPSDDLNECWIWTGTHILGCPTLWLRGQNTSVSLRLFLAIMVAGVPYDERDAYTTRRDVTKCKHVECYNPMHRRLLRKPSSPQAPKPTKTITRKKKHLSTLEQWDQDAREYLSQV